jgi:hypothetical protein
MANYRARVLNGGPAANGDVHLDCWIQREVETDVWEDVPMGHRSLVLNGAAILSITESAMTDQQKLTALQDLFRQKAASWGIHESDDAYNQLYDLLPAGWPVNVSLD